MMALATPFGESKSELNMTVVPFREVAPLGGRLCVAPESILVSDGLARSVTATHANLVAIANARLIVEGDQLPLRVGCRVQWPRDPDGLSGLTAACSFSTRWVRWR
jgi:hypothetical protein